MRPLPLLTTILLLPLATPTTFHPLTPAGLTLLPRPADSDFNIHTGAILAPILIPRVPGTENSLKVLRHFQSFFGTHLPGWSVGTQNSSATTPLSGGKEIPFVNFFATKDPPWSTPGSVGRIVLVAHYDSKVTPEGFIGATDSAVPCALILHAVRAVDKALERRWGRLSEAEKEAERGVMVLLLDGEEAWKNWTDDDSLYGARSLATHWESQHHPAPSTRRNHLANIDLFLLLDLLGAAAPKISSFYPTTHWAYAGFSALEKQLRNKGAFASHVKNPEMWFWQGAGRTAEGTYQAQVLDDHVPFLNRGVDVLHVIPTPFPDMWHRMGDDGEHLDMDTVGDWGVLVTGWLVWALGLEADMGEGKGKRKVALGIKTKSEL